MSKNAEDVALTGRRHLATLDGLRGVAAFAVLIKHMTAPDAVALAPQAALAVDFFFGLSGFVVASAYEERLLNGLSLWKFSKIRLIRLYPLIFLAAIFGAIGLFKLYGAKTISILWITGVFLIPTPLGAASEDGPPIPINFVSWSLLWELLVNGFYALIVSKLTDRRLIALIAVSAIAVVGTAIYCDGFDMMGSRWTFAWAGAPRVIFSYFVGVGLYRLWRAGKLPTFSLPLPALVVLLWSTFLISSTWRWHIVAEICVVFGLFPLILTAGANAKSGSLTAACAFLGAVSYPMYILQSGILQHLRGIPAHFHLSGVKATLVEILLALFFMMFSWIVLKLFDEPVRKLLMDRMHTKNSITPGAVGR